MALFSRKAPAPTLATQVSSASQIVWLAVGVAHLVSVCQTLFASSDETGEETSNASVPTRKELRAAAKQAGIRGYSKMNKTQLTEALVSVAS